MKILMTSYEFPPLGGGGAQVVRGLSRELVRLGHEVDLVTMGFHGLPSRETVNGVRVLRVPCVRTKASMCHAPELASYVIGAWPTVRRLLRTRTYDVVHAHFILPDGILSGNIKRTRGLPTVITAHGSDVPGYNPDRFQRLHRIIAPLWTRVVAANDVLVCPSSTLGVLICERMPEAEAKVTMIPNGIDVSKLQADGQKRPRILTVTRMFERKGVQHLLQALEGLDLAHEVHVVGTGPYLPRLRELAEKRRLDVTFHGWIDNASPDLRQLYETSSIFVFPSEAENFPIVLLEAMAAGLAIVTTRNTGCEEVVGDAALLVDPGDVEGVRSALARLTADPSLVERLGRAARKRLRENYSWEAVARRYVGIYQERVNGAPLAATA